MTNPEPTERDWADQAAADALVHVTFFASEEYGKALTAVAAALRYARTEGFEIHKQLVRDMNERVLKAQIEADQDTRTENHAPATFSGQAERFIEDLGEWSRAVIQDLYQTAYTEREQEAERRDVGRDDLLIAADSYLSLLYSRHIRRDSIDTSLDLELQQVLGKLRKSTNEIIKKRGAITK